MNKLFLLIAMALLVAGLAAPAALAAEYGVPRPTSYAHMGACTNPGSPDGCYGGDCHNINYGYTYGYSYRGEAWSKWAPIRLKYHYPYSSGFYAPYSGWRQYPAPYSHRY